MKNNKLLIVETNMPLYTKSNGQQIETSTMPEPYLERALAKAQANGNTENVAVLTAEITARENGTTTTDGK